MVGKKKKFQFKVKTWQLALLLIPLGFISATLLRFDHLAMLDLKTAVVSADETGDAEKITTALNELKTFTESHIVINIEEKNGNYEVYYGSGEIYLAHEYERTATALKVQAQEQAGVYANPNGNIYAKAMSVCQPLAHANGWSWNTPAYIQCYQDELAKYPTSESVDTDVTVSLPDTSLYRYDFASPVWNFSPSGLVLLLTAALALFVLIRFIAFLVLQLAILFVK